MKRNLQVNKKRTGLILVRFLFILAFFSIIATSVFVYFNAKPLTEEPGVPGKMIMISSGMSTGHIGDLLEKEGLIQNSFVFKFVVRALEVEHSLQAGYYFLRPQMSLVEIINHLNTGDILLKRVVIPEGFEIEQIAKTLADHGLADEVHFKRLAFNGSLIFGEDMPHDLPIDSLEGYLFPDTYFFSLSQTEESIIRQMIQRFTNVVTNEVLPLLSDSSFTLHELVTLASIVEKEIMVAEERALAASVYLNRLDINMPLQADPTVRYVTEEKRPQVLYKDLDIDSPYNTYRNLGLPPGPIASPGLASMLAVLNPKETDYLFFVSRRDGTHEFTRTYTEHLEARRLLGY